MRGREREARRDGGGDDDANDSDTDEWLYIYDSRYTPSRDSWIRDGFGYTSSFGEYVLLSL